MTEPYLIAHVVRGEPAFDIAERAVCPECGAQFVHMEDGSIVEGCDECDSTGFWWICSTSGHRARPYRTWPMEDLYDGSDMDTIKPLSYLDRAPDGWPDHYPINDKGHKAEPTAVSSLLARLGLGAKPSEPMKRRI